MCDVAGVCVYCWASVLPFSLTFQQGRRARTLLRSYKKQLPKDYVPRHLKGSHCFVLLKDVFRETIIGYRHKKSMISRAHDPTPQKPFFMG
jgi:hypothetical protein